MLLRFGYDKFILNVRNRAEININIRPINGKSNKSIAQITFAYFNIKTDKVSNEMMVFQKRLLIYLLLLWLCFILNIIKHWYCVSFIIKMV
jgi:hypothetical protein